MPVSEQHRRAQPSPSTSAPRPVPTPAMVRAAIGLGIAVSVVHYVDNAVRWNDFVPADPADVTFSFIQRWTIPVAWVGFTGCAVLALRALRDRRWERVAALTGAYSCSGLIGFGHYIDIPPSQLSAFQNTHVLLDGVLGLLLAGLAVWIVSRLPELRAIDGVRSADERRGPAALSPARALATMVDRVFDRFRHPSAFAVDAAASTAHDFASLREHRYALLVTFRRDGTPVPSPVWFALEGDDRLYVESAADAAKVRRLRHDSTAIVCASTARGRPLGPVVSATADLLTGAEAATANAALARSVGWQRRAFARTAGRMAGPSAFVLLRPAR